MQRKEQQECCPHLTSSPVSGGSVSDSKGRGCQPPSGLSSPTPPASACCAPDGQTCRSTETSEPSSRRRTTRSSAAGSPARTSPETDAAPGSPAPAQASGPSTSASSGRRGRSGSSSRTSRPLGHLASTKFSGTLPRSGIALDGTVYRLAPLARTMRGTGSGLLPTPRASEWKGCGPEGSASHQHWKHRRYLTALVSASGKLNPTFAEQLMGFPQGWTDV